MTGTSFELRGATVDWTARGGGRALDGVDLSIGAGERVAVVGPSGSGKTTLLRLLGAARVPTSGEVSIDGEHTTDASAKSLRRLRSTLGFVHQDHCLVASLRVSQNVIAGKLGQRGGFSAFRSMVLPARADLERAHEILETLGIGDKLFQRVDRLSGGEAQRVAIARALFQEPRALLADEPVASVDPARSRDLVARLVETAAERGTSLVVSLHDVELARGLFPRIVGLRGGRLQFDGSPDELRGDVLDGLYRLEDATRD